MSFHIALLMPKQRLLVKILTFLPNFVNFLSYLDQIYAQVLRIAYPVK